MTDSQEIRGIHAGRVGDWLKQHIVGAEGPFTFHPIAGGHSNLTYRVEYGDGRSVVLRRPPLGAVLKTAHDMAREHRILSAVGTTSVPVPRTLGLCEDETVNDAPFYIMEYVDGVVLVNAEISSASLSPAARETTSRSVAAVLADLHRVDPDQIELGTLGKKEDYLARQLRRWRRQWDQSKTRELPTMERVADVLEERMPEQIGSAIVHGDFRLGNMLTASDGHIAAVLDWELCTLGDPLADVGFLLNDWLEPGETPIGAIAAPGPTATPGFWSRQQLIDEYERSTGRDLGGIDYYRAFQYWRLAAIVEGVLARYLQGVMADAGDTEGFRRRVDAMAMAAERLLA